MPLSQSNLDWDEPFGFSQSSYSLLCSFIFRSWTTSNGGKTRWWRPWLQQVLTSNDTSANLNSLYKISFNLYSNYIWIKFYSNEILSIKSSSNTVNQKMIYSNCSFTDKLANNWPNKTENISFYTSEAKYIIDQWYNFIPNWVHISKIILFNWRNPKQVYRLQMSLFLQSFFVLRASAVRGF